MHFPAVHEATSVVIFPVTYMKYYYHNKGSGLVSFLIRFAVICSLLALLKAFIVKTSFSLS